MSKMTDDLLKAGAVWGGWRGKWSLSPAQMHAFLAYHVKDSTAVAAPVCSVPVAPPAAQVTPDEAMARYLRVCRSGGMPTELSEKIANAVAEAARLGYFDAPAIAPGLTHAQEPKYTVNGHAIVNRSTAQEIPADEPVFVFRARDPKAVPALFAYEAIIADPGHRAAVFARINQFRKFADEHPERMKEPDTAVSSVS